MINVVQDHSEIRADGAVEGIEGGPLLAARSVSTLAFYDWETGDLVRRLEVVAKGIYWSDSAELVAIAAEDTLFVLKYDADAKNDEEGDEDGIQSAFDVVCTSCFCGERWTIQARLRSQSSQRCGSATAWSS